jgi:dTDP-4-dehydrorhamnose 3,5-epimerase
MKVERTALPGVLLVEPRIFRDERGLFLETFHDARNGEAGVAGPFVQDNFSRSRRGTLRGLHFQEPQAQGKLVQVLRGTVFDVAVDIRRGSPTFGKWLGLELDGETQRQLWVPPGFAHGFYVLSDEAEFMYKCTALYAPQCERSIRWNDPELGIAWPTPDRSDTPLLSKKDAEAPLLKDAPLLPSY